MKSVMPTDFPSLGAPWLISGIAGLFGRSKLANRMPPITNVAISNVPGPQVAALPGGREDAHLLPGVDRRSTAWR